MEFDSGGGASKKMDNAAPIDSSVLSHENAGSDLCLARICKYPNWKFLVGARVARSKLQVDSDSCPRTRWPLCRTRLADAERADCDWAQLQHCVAIHLKRVFAVTPDEL